LWEFPGGKMREGESTFEAVRRELTEELALDTRSVGQVLYTALDPGSPFEIRFVEAVVYGEPLAREHTAVRWASATDLTEMRLAPSDARFVRDCLMEEERG